MKTITVRIKENLYIDFKLYCVKNNKTIQDAINDLIGNLLENGHKTTQNSNKEVVK